MCMNWTERAVHGAQPAQLGILPGYSFELAGEILNPLAKDVDLIKGEPDNLPYGVRHIRARLLHQAGGLLEVSRPLRDHHPELCQMATQGIDQLRALTDKALTGPEVDRACLVLGAFDGDAMNFRPHGSFGDCGRIGRIILLAFDEWLGVDWCRLAGFARHHNQHPARNGPNNGWSRMLPLPQFKATARPATAAASRGTKLG